MQNSASVFFAPHLYIPNGTKDVDFYKRAFDAIELRRWENDDGTLHVIELSIHGAMFHIHEEKKSAGLLSPAVANGTTSLIGLFVEDVDLVVDKAVSAGATIFSPAQTYDYGYRQAEVKDPFGHIWLIEKKV